ncbi:hypothetical protein WA026_000577 [Henosepilachna vigintioctopunctata]|uniref:Carboxylesterase type B domain-containing protein n=1 Tax=Henosepilachna vigintioctopunctata TaxID=420089 RepID=A0AAW1V7P0_9CUCU
MGTSKHKEFWRDPTKITVAGQSAGAASVGYQLLGSNAEGLFRGVIQASGSSLGAWTLQRDPKGYAYQVANYIEPSINEENTCTKELVEFLRKTDVSLIKKACEDIFGKNTIVSFFNTFRGYVFSGVIEPEHDGAFITETAFEKFESGNFNVVPTLIGITSEESLAFVNVPEFSGILKEYDESPELMVTPDMHIADVNVKRLVGRDIRRFYVGDGLWQDNIGPAMKMVSDGGFGRPNIKQAELESKFTDVYFYEFAYSGAMGRRGRPEPQIPGADTVGHGDDLRYVFPASREDLKNFSEQDLLTSDRYSLIWANFIKYLNPTPEPSDVLQNVIWPKVTPNSFPYLFINETLQVKYDLKKSMMDEYAKLYKSYGIPPRDTY